MDHRTCCSQIRPEQSFVPTVPELEMLILGAAVYITHHAQVLVESTVGLGLAGGEIHWEIPIDRIPLFHFIYGESVPVLWWFPELFRGVSKLKSWLLIKLDRPLTSLSKK